MTDNSHNISHGLTSYLAALLAIALAVPAHGQFGPNVRAVDQAATGANNGTTWADAYVHLRDALDFASDPLNEVTELWVAAGTYYPDECDT